MSPASPPLVSPPKVAEKQAGKGEVPKTDEAKKSDGAARTDEQGSETGSRDPSRTAPLDGPELNDDGSEKVARRDLLALFSRTAVGFWRGSSSSIAWSFTAALVGITVLVVSAAYAMNLWNRAIFDSLQNGDRSRVAMLSLVYFAILLTSVIIGMAQVYIRMKLQRRWRQWLTDVLIDRWLRDGRYYQLGLLRGDHANPEARIAEDARLATEAPVDFVSGILTAFLSAATFIVVLWTIGGALDITVGSFNLHIPGFLVVAALLYAVIASGAMMIIGGQFVRASEAKNQAEAELRYMLTRTRENGESIALIRGEEEERNAMTASFRKAIGAWAGIARQTIKTTMVSQTSSFVAPVLPIILCAPKMLDGSMSLGQVMQAASAFTIVQQAFNWIVDNYPKMAEWTASASRAASLIAALDALDVAEKAGIGQIEIRQENVETALHLQNVAVRLNDGTAVVQDTDVSILPGERVLIAGESGSGKSTLVRAIAGLWPWGSGRVVVKQGAKLFLLPQRPYVPVGTLRRAVSYPEAPETFEMAEVTSAFEKVGLGHLKDRLEEQGFWDQSLSGGEKQRLAFARILLHKPDIIVLDEATAALDPKSQIQLMSLLSETPELTVLSVGHRPELEQFHSRKIELARKEGGAKLVRDIDLGDPLWLRWNRMNQLFRKGRPRTRMAAN